MTDTRMLYRSDAIDTSIDAAYSIDVTVLEDMVLAAIVKAGLVGITQQELLDMFPNFSYSSITARPSSLKRKGLIEDSGARRKGNSGRSQSVLVAVSDGRLF